MYFCIRDTKQILPDLQNRSNKFHGAVECNHKLSYYYSTT